MKKRIFKNTKLNKSNIPEIYSCYNFKFIIKFIIKFFGNKESINNIFGIKRFDFQYEKKYPEISISEIEDFEYLAFHFILVTKRFYRKILKLKTNEIIGIPDEGQNCINIRYLISLVEINLKSIPKSNFVFHCCSSGNKIVDELFKRYYLRKYSIKIKISQISLIIKPSKDLDFDWKRLSIDKVSFIKPFLKTKRINLFSNSNKGFIQHKYLKDYRAYYKLIKDLSMTNEFISLDYLSMYSYGNNNKFKLISDILNYSLNIFKNNFWKIIKHNIFFEVLEIISCKIYYLCCINTINSLKIKYIVCSYISFKHENILFQACRDTKTVSIFYDYSGGYPVNKNHPGYSQIDLNRNPNYLLTFGSQRCELYKSVKRLKSEYVEVKNALCPQIEFAREQNKNKENLENDLDHKKYNSKVLKISIFDNLIGFNYHIKEIDVVSCIDSLKVSKLEKILLVHNKKDGFFKQYIKNSNLSHIFQERANLSNSYYSDFIISLGFEWAAIKSAIAFNKPIIFFSENKKFFKDAYFFCNNEKNEMILSFIKELTFNGDKLINSIASKSVYKDFISKIKFHSEELFTALNLYNTESASSIIDKIINKN